MKEIELKFQIDNEKQIREKLKKMNFKRKKTEKHIDIPLSQVYNQLIEPWVRIRCLPLSKKIKITIKGKPKIDNKLDTIRDEVEFFVDEDIETVKTFFKLIGYIPMGSVKKLRESYIKDNIEISIDKVKNLGLFLEIEIKDRNERDAIRELEKYKKLLCLKDTDIVNRGYFDLQNKDACRIFYQIINNMDKEDFIVKIPKNISIKRVLKNVLRIKEKGSYFIGFLYPFKI